jgi:Uncharacterized protein conserved in bacteria (DUF2188)
MSSKGQHVVPSGGKWSVRRTGASRASGTFATQNEAVERELYIHGRDGRIHERSSYNKASSPTKG